MTDPDRNESSPEASTEILKTRAVKLSQNPTEEKDFQEWAEIYKKEKKPTLLAAIDQYRREFENYSSRYLILSPKSPLTEEEKVERDLVFGFMQVSIWLK